MLGFVAPLRHPASSSSYDTVCRNLATTLGSIARQSDPRWRAVIVGNQAPPWPMPDGIEFIEVEIDPPFVYPQRPNTQSEVTLDKGRKIAIGIAHLRSLGVTHVMPFDGDDLLHRDLSEYVNSHPECPGWYSDCGLMNLQGTRLLWDIPTGFNQRNGSTHIVRADLIPIPPEIVPGMWIDELEQLVPRDVLAELIGRHRAWEPWAAEMGHPLKVLPFPSAAWIVGTGENQSRVEYQSGATRAIDASITKDFGLERPSLLRHSTRRGGAISRRVMRRFSRL